MLELSIKGNINKDGKDVAKETFEISPAIVHNQKSRFVISIKNNKYLDYEKIQKIDFKVCNSIVSIAGQV